MTVGRPPGVIVINLFIGVVNLIRVNMTLLIKGPVIVVVILRFGPTLMTRTCSGFPKLLMKLPVFRLRRNGQ